jgi:hypothetical protein
MKSQSEVERCVRQRRKDRSAAGLRDVGKRSDLHAPRRFLKPHELEKYSIQSAAIRLHSRRAIHF